MTTRRPSQEALAKKAELPDELLRLEEDWSLGSASEASEASAAVARVAAARGVSRVCRVASMCVDASMDRCSDPP